MLKIVAFLVGFCLAAGAEVLLLEALDLMPRGAGWAVLPFIAGASLSSAAPSLVERVSAASPHRSWTSSKPLRAVTVVACLWLVAVPAYWWLFEPYDYSMGDEDWLLMGKVMLFPVVLLVCAFIAFEKVVESKSSSRPAGSPAASWQPASQPGDKNQRADLLPEYEALGVRRVPGKSYFEYGGLHFDRIEDAIAHAQYQKQRSSGA